MAVTHVLTGVTKEKLPAEEWNKNHVVAINAATEITAGSLAAARMQENIVAALGSQAIADACYPNAFLLNCVRKLTGTTMYRNTDNAEMIYGCANALQNGAYIYMCGGGRASIPGYMSIGFGDRRAGYNLESELNFYYQYDTTVRNILKFDRFGNFTMTGSLPTMSLPIKVSDTLRNSNDTQRGHNNTTWEKYKEIRLNSPLNASRIKFDLWSSSPPRIAYGKIYLNGTPIGTEQTEDQGVWTTKTQDFTTLKAGKNDLLQLYGKVSSVIGYVYVRNLRLYYDKDDTVTRSTTNQDP